MEEIWRDVVDWEGYYQVSNLGRVKSLSRKVNGRNNKPNVIIERIRKQRINAEGYYSLPLNRFGLVKTVRVHRLIAEAFLPNPENKTDVNHINSNRADNSLSNLEWATRSENVTHGYVSGNRTKARGKLNKLSISVNQYDLDMNFIKKHWCVSEAQSETGAFHICQVCKGTRKTSAGFIWEYADE